MTTIKRLQPVGQYRDHNEFEQQIISCEVCGAQRPMRDMNSLALVYRMPGRVDHGHRVEYKGSYQCPDLQHFGCCHEHAMLAAIQCMLSHIHDGPHNAAGQALSHPILTKLKEDFEALYEEEAVEGSLEDVDG